MRRRRARNRLAEIADRAAAAVADAGDHEIAATVALAQIEARTGESCRCGTRRSSGVERQLHDRERDDRACPCCTGNAMHQTLRPCPRSKRICTGAAPRAPAPASASAPWHSRTCARSPASTSSRSGAIELDVAAVRAAHCLQRVGCGCACHRRRCAQRIAAPRRRCSACCTRCASLLDTRCRPRAIACARTASASCRAAACVVHAATPARRRTRRARTAACRAQRQQHAPAAATRCNGATPAGASSRLPVDLAGIASLACHVESYRRHAARRTRSQCRPELPKPPSPRSLGANSSTTSKRRAHDRQRTPAARCAPPARW